MTGDGKYLDIVFQQKGSCCKSLSSLYSKSRKTGEKHGSGIEEVTIMSLFNLLDPNWRRSPGFTGRLLGVYLWGGWGGAGQTDFGVFPVKTMSELSASLQLSLGKSKPPFTVRASYKSSAFSFRPSSSRFLTHMSPNAFSCH